MGWKAAFIICGEQNCEAGYLGTLPQHNPSRADKIATQLDYTRFANRQITTFEPYPDEGTFLIGAYEKATFVADQDVIFHCFENRKEPYFQRALALYPAGTLLILVLHSVVNLFGYAYYENQKLVREYGGNTDQGVTSEFGNPLPEEKSAFERSKIKNGTRYFQADDGREYRVDAYGEELAFQVTSKYFGQPLDRTLPGHNDHFALEMEFFYKQG